MTEALLSDWIKQASGYVASALVLTTFCMGTMFRLRITAITSNVAFIFYAAAADTRPVLILHSILLPVNIVRLVQTGLACRTAGQLLNESVTGRSGAPDTRSASRAPAATMSR